MKDVSLHIERNMSREERALFLNTFCRTNLHFRGACVSDILEILYDSDSHIEQVDPLYDAHREEIDSYTLGLFPMCVYVAIYTKLGTDWNIIRSLLQRFSVK